MIDLVSLLFCGWDLGGSGYTVSIANLISQSKFIEGFYIAISVLMKAHVVGKKIDVIS